MIRVYILPGGDEEERKRCLSSLANLPVDIVELEKDQFHFENHGECNLYMFLYGYERLSKNLAEAMLVLDVVEDYDFFSLYKKDYETTKASVSPRVFKKHIRMDGDCFTPCGVENLKGIEILDGWIEQGVPVSS